jgi:hypothetical protein
LSGSLGRAQHAQSLAVSRRLQDFLLQVSAVHVSLKRMLKLAVALAGTTLVAGLPTSIVVTSRLDGWKFSVPASKGRIHQCLRQLQDTAHGIVCKMRIGGMALHADVR